MSCRHQEPADIHFCHVSRKFNLGDSAARLNDARMAFRGMIRRRISSMPAGMVIAALVVIALIALVALFLFGATPEGASYYDAPMEPAVGFGQVGQ